MDKTELLNEVRRLYADYEAKFQAQEEKRKPMEGAFGLGGGPRSYPCHEEFAEQLKTLLHSPEAESLSPEQTRQLLEYICFAPARHPDGQDAVYWMKLAVHSLTTDLLPRLEAEDAKALHTAYQNIYPRRDRLPAQETLLKALKKRGKAGK